MRQNSQMNIKQDGCENGRVDETGRLHSTCFISFEVYFLKIIFLPQTRNIKI